MATTNTAVALMRLALARRIAADLKRGNEPCLACGGFISEMPAKKCDTCADFGAPSLVDKSGQPMQWVIDGEAAC